MNRVCRALGKTTPAVLFPGLVAMIATPRLAYAGETNNKAVRVGWYESSYNTVDKFGRRSGYAYEYQLKIASYTGWSYEYVNGSWSELLQMLLDGKIDLMSDVSYTEERAMHMLFPDYPMGAEDYYLFVDPDNQEISSTDASTLNGKRVGVNKDSVLISSYRYNNISRFCERHNLTTLPTAEGLDSCFAVRKGCVELYSALAKAVGQIPSSTVNSALSFYITQDAKLTTSDFVYANITVIFVPLLERHGKINEVDKHVWDQVASQVVRWHMQSGVTIPVSVNLSRADVFDPMLESVLDGILLGNGLKPDVIRLEVTDSAYAEDANRLSLVVEKLRKKGYMVAMDDFGIGYSSLYMLSGMPIDALKMDRAFIRNIEDDDRACKLVNLILGMARSLGVAAIAEGVETESQLQLLKQLGCTLAQGFYLPRPLHPSDFEAEYLKGMGR